METAIVTCVISGVFSLATALGSVWLKHNLEQRDPAPVPSKRKVTGEKRVIVHYERGWSLSRPLAVLLGGFVIGIMSRILRPRLQFGRVHYEMLATLVLLAVIGILLMLIHRKSRRGFWLYQLETISLWAAFTSGWSLTHGYVWSDLLTTTAGWWLAWALAGGMFVIAFRRRGAPA